MVLTFTPNMKILNYIRVKLKNKITSLKKESHTHRQTQKHTQNAKREETKKQLTGSIKFKF